ncbi:hydroxysteroid dehydrogenase 1 [Rhynchospora pubera]|uniref:Hydroxysteroid dehydrogenase 1 n=1 Tax=Rhynchospora pubera TaxID=906938 RepID=A0AAV8FIT1_9POAL|nr:hydroxysteroid dehydrogenase 1 [Rhynchospora pubera]
MTMYNASKGAVRNFYHTLRIELGADIDITEIIPGVIESEITKGKIFTEEGRLEVDQDLRDASLGIVPIERTKAFARAVVERVCSDARWVLEPPWYIGLYYIRMLIPEVAEWGMRLLFVTPPGVPATEDLAKKLANLPFVKEILYPPSVRSPEIKRD